MTKISTVALYISLITGQLAAGAPVGMPGPVAEPAPKVLDFELRSHIKYPKLEDLAQLRKRSYEGLMMKRDGATSGDSSDNTVYSSLDDRIIAYTMDIGLGEPNSTYSMIVDTGSSELWVGNTTNITAKPYDAAADTAKNMSGPIQRIVYGIGQVAMQWGTTTLSLSQQVKLPNAPFGVAFQSAELQTFSHVSGLIGLAYTERNHTNLPQLLKNQGLIESVSYSLALNSKKNSSSVLFGGLDRSKYTGQLTSVPRVNITGSSHRYLAVNLTTLNLANSVNRIPVNKPILLDSGTTYTYLPTELYTAITSYLGVDPAITSKYGEPMLDVETYGDFVIEFEFSGAAKFQVKARDLTVPVSTFNLQEVGSSTDAASSPAPTPSAAAAAPTIIPDPASKAEDKYVNAKYVPLGLTDTGSGKSRSSVLILGERVLQAAYLVFDLDSDRVAIAQANDQADDLKRDYAAITGAGIPGAVVVV